MRIEQLAVIDGQPGVQDAAAPVQVEGQKPEPTQSPDPVAVSVTVVPLP